MGMSARAGVISPQLPLTVGRRELLRDGDDEQFRRMLHDLLAFSGKLQELRERMGGFIGLSGPAYTILISIAHMAARAEVGVTSVARHLSLSQPYVTAEVNKLVAAGLVDKAASDSDGRSVSLTVTPEAVALLTQLAARQRDINDRLFAHLGVASFDMLAGIAARLVHDADRALELAALNAAGLRPARGES